MAEHFPIVVDWLDWLTSGRSVAASTYAALVKAKAIVADEPDPSALALVKTPWGHADSVCVHDDGIRFFETPKHGGFHLDAERNASMPESWQNDDAWYEEDAEWAKVVVTFPDIFEDDLRTRAEGIVQRSFPLNPVKNSDDSMATLLRAIANEIDAFDAECDMAQKTDTGALWCLLHDWRDQIRSLADRDTKPFLKRCN